MRIADEVADRTAPDVVSGKDLDRPVVFLFALLQAFRIGKKRSVYEGQLNVIVLGA